MHAIQGNAGSSAEQVFTLEREKLEWLSPDGISASHRLLCPWKRKLNRQNLRYNISVQPCESCIFPICTLESTIKP